MWCVKKERWENILFCGPIPGWFFNFFFFWMKSMNEAIQLSWFFFLRTSIWSRLTAYLPKNKSIFTWICFLFESYRRIIQMFLNHLNAIISRPKPDSTQNEQTLSISASQQYQPFHWEAILEYIYFLCMFVCDIDIVRVSKQKLPTSVRDITDCYYLIC